MNRRKPRTCGRKKRFRDEYEADRKLRQSQNRAEREGGSAAVRWYYHSECGGFHLTSRPLALVEDV